MRRGSLIQRYAYVVHLSVLLTQLTHKEQGFRLKDIRLSCEQVSRWISFDGQGYEFAIELMQIKRLLQSLEERGWVELRIEDKKKYYHLGRKGFVGLLESFRQHNELTTMEEALLLFYTLRSWQGALVDYLLPPGNASSDRLHVLGLIRPEWFIEDYIRKLDKRIGQIQIRIEENPEGGCNDILFTALRDNYEQRRRYLAQHLEQFRDQPNRQSFVWDNVGTAR